MKITFFLAIACFVFIHQLPAQQPTPSQIKKGQWMISHDIFNVGYETRNAKAFTNDVYAGKEKQSGFQLNLMFQGPYWGGVYANSSKLEATDANGVDKGGYKRSGFTFSFQPSIGRFISDRFLLGAELNLYYSTDKTDYFTPNDSEENDTRYLALGIGPHIRYYFGRLKGKQLYHAGVSAGISYGSTKQTSSDNGGPAVVYKSKQPNYYAKPYIGSSWFVGKHWTFGASLSWRAASTRYKLTTDTYSSRSTTTVNDFSLDGSVSFTF